jgi:hypothetical protein
MRGIIFFLLVFILSFSFTSALIISPGIAEINYVEGGKTNFEVLVINDIGEEIVIEIGYRYTDYEDNFDIINIDSNKIIIPAGDIATLWFSFDFDEEFTDFGKQRLGQIRFYQVPTTGAGTVGATVAVSIPIDTIIPFPEKFVLPGVQPVDIIEAGESVEVTANLVSKGTNVIDTLTGYFVLQGENFYQEMETNEIFSVVIPTEENIVSTIIDTKGMPSQEYELTFIAEYDGLTTESKPQEFLIGGEKIIVDKIHPKEFTPNTYNAVTVTLRSLWVDDLTPTITAKMFNSEGTQVRDYNFGTYTIESGKTKEVTYSMDMGPVGQGIYDLEVIASYDTSQGVDVESKIFEIKVGDDQVPVSMAPTISEGANSVILVAGAISLMIILIVVIFLLMKKMVISNEEEDDEI